MTTSKPPRRKAQEPKRTGVAIERDTAIELAHDDRRGHGHGHEQGHDQEQGHDHDHEQGREHGHEQGREHGHEQGREHGPGHDHNHGDQARELLRQRGLRITGPRLAVLTALLDEHRPTSAQELIDAVAAQGMDQVTVYRTLNTLVDEGIAQAVGTTDRGRRFEVHACEGCRIDHPHLQCRSCGALECLEHGLLPALLVPTEVGGFLVDEAKLYLYGLCPKCRPQRPALGADPDAPAPRRRGRAGTPAGG